MEEENDQLNSNPVQMEELSLENKDPEIKDDNSKASEKMHDDSIKTTEIKDDNSKASEKMHDGSIKTTEKKDDNSIQASSDKNERLLLIRSGKRLIFMILPKKKPVYANITSIAKNKGSKPSIFRRRMKVEKLLKKKTLNWMKVPKRYACEVCKAAFVNKLELAAHSVTHTPAPVMKTCKNNSQIGRCTPEDRLKIRLKIQQSLIKNSPKPSVSGIISSSRLLAEYIVKTYSERNSLSPDKEKELHQVVLGKLLSMKVAKFIADA